MFKLAFHLCWFRFNNFFIMYHLNSIWNGILFHRVTNCILTCSHCDAVAHSWAYALCRRLNVMILWRSLSNLTILCLLLLVANITQRVHLAGIGENPLSCSKVSSTLHLVAQSCSWGPDLPYRPLVNRAMCLKRSHLVKERRGEERRGEERRGGEAWGS